MFLKNDSTILTNHGAVKGYYYKYMEKCMIFKVSKLKMGCGLLRL